MANARQVRKEPAVKPVVVLIVCLCVVAMMFAGSIFIGAMVIQAEKSQPASADTDAPAQR